MSQNENLLKIGEKTADAVAELLRALAGDVISRDAATIVPQLVGPLEGLPTPAVATSVSYVDGVAGGNLFAMTCTGARKLAALMMGTSPDEVGDEVELTEMELSAVGEAMNQMMAAAAAATATVLGHDVEISPPETKFLSDAAEAAAASDAGQATTTSQIATSTSFTIAGEPCRLIQLVPHAFLIRMQRAFEEREAELAGQTVGEGAESLLSHEAILDVRVRLAAELGRVEVPIGRLVSLPPSTVLELDQAVDAPLELRANGRRFATARLLVEDGEWAVRIEEIDPIAMQDIETKEVT